MFIFECLEPSNIEQCTNEDAADLGLLFAQLSFSSAVATQGSEIMKRLRTKAEPLPDTRTNTIVFFVRDPLVRPPKGRIIATATLVPMDLILGRAGMLHDVIVDLEYRGRGLGRQLMQKVIERARSLQITRLDLTSNPNREAARKLYEQLGFRKCVTDVF